MSNLEARSNISFQPDLEPKRDRRKTPSRWRIALENLQRIESLNGIVVDILPILEQHMPHHAHYPKSVNTLPQSFVQNSSPYEPDPYSGYLEEHGLKSWDDLRSQDTRTYIFELPRGDYNIGITPPEKIVALFPWVDFIVDAEDWQRNRRLNINASKVEGNLYHLQLPKSSRKDLQAVYHSKPHDRHFVISDSSQTLIEDILAARV